MTKFLSGAQNKDPTMAVPSISLPDTLSYGTKSGLPKIKSYQIPYSSTNLTYTVNSQTVIRCDIPPVANAYHETQSSFLSFRVSVATADLQLDNSAYAFFNTISVYSQGQSVLLEQVTDQALLAALLWDLTSSIDSTMQTYSTLAGFNETTRRQGATITAGTNRTFCIPLLSVLGLFSEKLLPACGYTLLLTLNNLTTVGNSAGAPTATIDNVFYYAMIHEMDPAIQNMIMSANNGVITVPVTSFRSYSSTVAANTYSNSFAIGARFSILSPHGTTQTASRTSLPPISSALGRSSTPSDLSIRPRCVTQTLSKPCTRMAPISLS
jgi:hypothetical protein